MSTAVYLKLFNPSPTKVRGGPVVTAWEPIARAGSLGPTPRVFYDGREIPSQVDRLDPLDASRDELAFALPDSALSPGDEHYRTECGKVSVSDGGSKQSGKVYAAQQPTGVNFGNEALDVYLNTVPESPQPARGHEKWFAGAFTSVQLHRFEMLDPIAAMNGWHHHPEKRIQLDRVHLVRPPWDPDRSVNFELYQHGWSVVSTSQGPVRATVTIASAPFKYECGNVDPSAPDIVLTCRVYRAISIYPGRDWFLEKIWVKASRDKAPPVYLWFRPRYFLMTNLSLRPEEFRYPDHPGWFTITSEFGDGYAFATDAHAGPVWRPPLDHADPKTRHRAFEWELGATRCATAIHLFRRNTNRLDLADRVGDVWYTDAFKPLKAAI